MQYRHQTSFGVWAAIAAMSCAAMGAFATRCAAQSVPPTFPPQYPTTNYPANPGAPGSPNQVPGVQYGPQSPQAPVSTARPGSWPGGSQDPARSAPPQQAMPQPYVQPPVAQPAYSQLPVGPPVNQAPAQWPANAAAAPPAYPNTGQPPAGYPGQPPQAAVQPPQAAAPPAGAPAAPPTAATVNRYIAPAAPVPTVVRKTLADPPYNPYDVLARVGGEIVQANEVLPDMHERMEHVKKENAEALARMPQEMRDEQLRAVEKALMQGLVNSSVQLKLLLAEVKAKMPAEGIEQNEKRIRDSFNREEIKGLMEKYKAVSIEDLERKLLAVGSSLDAQRTSFIDRYMAQAWLFEQVKDEQQPSHEQMLRYYNEHLEEWESPSRVRWEHLMVKFLNFESKAAAKAELAKWGNEIWRGAPFADVARAHSQGYGAAEGGVNDWVSKGSLRSTVVDEALFSLPVGAMSTIFEDEEGWHIVRVLERQEARRAPFSEVQDKIKEKLFNGGRGKHMSDYVEKLKARIPVSTVFDPPAVSQQPPTGATQ